MKLFNRSVNYNGHGLCHPVAIRSDPQLGTWWPRHRKLRFSVRPSIKIDTAWATPQSSAPTPSWAPGGPGSENTGFQLERQLGLTRFEPPRRRPLGPQLGTWRPGPQKWRFLKGTLIGIDTVWATPPDPQLSTWQPRLRKYRFSVRTSITIDTVWATLPPSSRTPAGHLEARPPKMKVFKRNVDWNWHSLGHSAAIRSDPQLGTWLPRLEKLTVFK